MREVIDALPLDELGQEEQQIMVLLVDALSRGDTRAFIEAFEEGLNVLTGDEDA